MVFEILTVNFFIAHLAGDYIVQNNWMANNKTLRWWPAFVHGFIYSLCYVPLLLIVHQTNVWAAILPWAVIFLTHVVIDHFRLVKPVIWAINQLAPRSGRYSWAEAKANGGYSAATPIWLATWLMIIADNTIHLAINAIAVVVL